MHQRSFASAEFALKKKSTRREVFLAEMERVVPWSRLEAVIEPLYPKSGRASAASPLACRACFACNACSSGTAWPTRRWKMRRTTVRRCGTSWASICRASRCPTPRRC